eukprot:1226640-Pyramimonas_sp.AAC.1
MAPKEPQEAQLLCFPLSSCLFFFDVRVLALIDFLGVPVLFLGDYLDRFSSSRLLSFLSLHDGPRGFNFRSKASPEVSKTVTRQPTG